MSRLKHLVEELDRAIDYYEHYRTGTIKQIAKDLAQKIIEELSKVEVVANGQEVSACAGFRH